MTKKEGLGKAWRGLRGEGEEVEGVKIEGFAPPVIEGEEWIFSVPAGDGLREGARVVLSEGGVPLVVSWQLGQGKVTWSGMNLAYHITIHKNMEEAKMLENIMAGMADISRKPLPGFEVKRLSGRELLVKGSGVKGVLFKEQDYDRWNADLSSRQGEEKVKIYNAGPLTPGYLYVRVPEEARGGDFEVRFKYRGSIFNYIKEGVSGVVILWVLDRVLLNSAIFGFIFRGGVKAVGKGIGGDDEHEKY